MGEDMVDRFVVILPQALQDHEIRGPRRQQELGDDLIRAAQVNQLDLGEAQQGGEAVGVRQGRLDPGTAAPVGRVTRLRYGAATASRSTCPIWIVWITVISGPAPG